MSLIAPLILMWALTQNGKRGGPAAEPTWPGPKHPPPSRLPAPPAPPSTKTKAVPDAAPPMPTAVNVPAVPEERAAAKIPATRDPAQAAQDLYNYVKKAIASKQTALLGTKSRPNPFVRTAQRDMGLIPADGIYGPATRARGKSILKGVNFPARVSGEDRPLYIP